MSKKTKSSENVEKILPIKNQPPTVSTIDSVLTKKLPFSVVNKKKSTTNKFLSTNNTEKDTEEKSGKDYSFKSSNKKSPSSSPVKGKSSTKNQNKSNRQQPNLNEFIVDKNTENKKFKQPVININKNNDESRNSDEEDFIKLKEKKCHHFLQRKRKFLILQLTVPF
jgi:cobalamin biosynthesis protein CobT